MSSEEEMKKRVGPRSINGPGSFIKSEMPFSAGPNWVSKSSKPLLWLRKIFGPWGFPAKQAGHNRGQSRDPREIREAARRPHGRTDSILIPSHPFADPQTGAGKGELHTEGFVIEDPPLACVESAKGPAMTVVDLRYNGAREGLALKADYKAPYSKEEYLKAWERLIS